MPEFSHYRGAGLHERVVPATVEYGEYVVIALRHAPIMADSRIEKGTPGGSSMPIANPGTPPGFMDYSLVEMWIRSSKNRYLVPVS
jgi:hypothetical protein